MAIELTQRQKKEVAVVFVSLVIIALFSWIVWRLVSDDDSPCSLSTLTQPTNGSWGTTCSSNSGEIQHGASCDLSCNTGYTASNQPTCNNGVLSSTTLTCTAGSSSGSTSGDDCTTPDPVPPGYNLTNVTGSPSKADFSIAGVECATGYTGTATATACSEAGGDYTLDGCSDINACQGINCGPNATCRDNIAPDTGYTCSCNTEYTGTDVENGPATCTPTVCPTGQNIPNIFGPRFGGIDQLQQMLPTGQENNNPCRDTAVNTQCNLGFNPCPDGHIGGTITCQADGSWDVVNCEAVVCNSEPEITDQHMSISAPERTSDVSGEERGRCTGANPGETCAHQCNTGYTGGSVTCVRDGDTAYWNIVACIETAPEPVNCNSEPVITDQHMSIIAPERTDSHGDSLGHCRNANPGETCAHRCDAGYTGGSVTCVRDGDTASWNIEACTEVSVAVPPPGGFTWILGETGKDCDETCQGDGHTCSEEGFWGVNGTPSFREKMALANYSRDEVNGLCPERWSYSPAGSHAAAPYISSTGHCYVSNEDSSTTCSYSDPSMRRLCRCT